MAEQLRVVLTGATGFVGNALSNRLVADGYDVTALIRRSSSDLDAAIKQIVIGDIADLTKQRSDDSHIRLQNSESESLARALTSADVVVHAAARVHVMHDKAVDTLTEFRQINTNGTLALAKQAAEAGVKRFIFLSTVKVHGETTDGRSPFKEDDDCQPTDPYAVSKWEAEQTLWELASETGMEIVIIRPPLIYGPDVKGNFASMLRLVEKGLPVPLGAVHNKRSLVALDNLVDLVTRCINHPAAANQVFLVSDGSDVSTTELLKNVAEAMGKPDRLVPVPTWLLKLGATVLGKKSTASRVLGSLQVDISRAEKRLGWRPMVTMKQQLNSMIARR